MPDDKKKQAMSLLFGDAPAKPTPIPKAAAESAPTKPKPKKSAGRSVAKETSNSNHPSKQPRKTAPPAAEPDHGGGGETPDPYYQGASRYRRASGEQVKHSVYLDPNVSQAVKVAAAMGDDPRGTNVSAIVNAALRELGYNA